MGSIVARPSYGTGFFNGNPAPVKGRIEMTQQLEYDVTNVPVTLDYLDDVNNYKIHVADYSPADPVERLMR
ncbi:unnamed protein product [Arctia plantaginis]|uniref:Uncharacterized protein n=1 Tax=Arctia plantaginis TaxID=874455 RepID=A0A8S1B3K1_ARCPL|nr:unnamed protein product [Arctia plantaginis]